MELVLISDEPNWVLKAIRQLLKNSIYSPFRSETGLNLLPIPTPNSQLIIGFTTYDAPDAQRAFQKVDFPEVRFTVKYPDYHISHQEQEQAKLSETVHIYKQIFGNPDSFINYYARVHSDADNREEYYRLVSEVLAHHWLSGHSVLPSPPELVRQTARAIAPFFKGAPENLRDFYIQEGKPFLDWLLRYV